MVNGLETEIFNIQRAAMKATQDKKNVHRCVTQQGT